MLFLEMNKVFHSGDLTRSLIFAPKRVVVLFNRMNESVELKVNEWLGMPTAAQEEGQMSVSAEAWQSWGMRRGRTKSKQEKVRTVRVGGPESFC